MPLNIETYGKLDLSNVIKSLDTFLKQKHKLNIDAGIVGLDKIQQELQKYQDAISKLIAERKKLDQSISDGEFISQHTEALKTIEQKEKELAAQREKLLRDFAMLQETITTARIEALERISSKEKESATKAEESINKQAAAFQRMYGSLREGVTLPIVGGTEDMSKAIRQMEGFAEASVKATGSVQVGEITLDRYIATLKNAGGGFDTYKISVNNATGAVYQLDQGLKSTDATLIHTSETANGVINAFAGAFAAAGVAKGLDEIKDALWSCAEASIEFESALAGVRKTTNLPISQMQILKEEILSLSTIIPTATTELSRIAEIGGQLNIPKENIVEFTRVMANLGVATTLTSEQAADFVARFSNITQLPMENWENLSSSLVQLGNNFAGTETEISDMALRLASAGKQAKMTDADILGLSAGLVAVGIKAEMGGTAFSKAMNKINIAVATGNDELKDFARVVGMTVQEFTDTFNTNASKALIAFVQGLADVERHGKNTIVLMDELGLTEVRMSEALRRAAGSGDLFKNAIEMSNQAFTENIALQNEASIRYATTESQTILLSNATDQLRIAIGDALTPAINNATGGMADFTLGAADFIKHNKLLVQAFTVLTVLIGTAAGGVALYAVGIRALAAAKLALAAATKTADAANKGFMATLVATPLGPVILALSALAAVITMVTIAVGESNAAAEEARRIAIESGAALKNESDALEAQKDKVIELRKALADGNLTQAEAATKRTELMSIQDELISKYGGEAKAIDLLGDSVDGLAEKYDNLIESAARTYLTDNQDAINKAKEYLEKEHSPNENFGFSTGTKVFFSGDAEAQMDKEVQEFMKSLSDSLGGKYGFVEKWDWDQWVFGGFSTELRFENVSTEQYLADLREFSERVKEYGNETGKDVSKILGDISKEINEWDNDKFKQQLAVMDKATEAETVSTYRDQYRAILDAQMAFNKAYAEGDIERSDEALRNILTAKDEAITAVGNDTYLQNYFNKMVEAQENAFKRLSWKDTISQNESVVESFKGLASDANLSEWSNEQQAALENLKGILNITSDDDIPKLITVLTEMGILTAPIEMVNELTQSLGELSGAFSTFSGEQSKLIDAQREMEKSGGLSPTTTLALIDELTKAGENYLDYLYAENGQMKLSADAYDAWSTSKIQNNLAVAESNKVRLESEKQALEAERANIQALLTQEQDYINKYGADAQGSNPEKVREYQSALASLDTQINTVTESLQRNNSEYQIQQTLQKNIEQSGYDQERKFIEADYKDRILNASEFYAEMERIRKKYYDEGSKLNAELAESNNSTYFINVMQEIEERTKVLQLL